jgi:hypothetical protein
MSTLPKIHGGRTYARAERKRLVARIADEDAAKTAAKADAFVQQFVDMTPAQVSAWFDANVTDLASARTAMKRMALMLLLLAKREFRD